MNKYEHPTSTANPTFLNNSGEENTYVRFEYIPQTIFNRTQVQVKVSMNSDPIITKKKSTIKNVLIKTKSPEQGTLQ